MKKLDSKGAILKNIEKNIANLDQWQKKAAIEVPEGPQRIRGLAGSGKTVVLALKAAYLHAQHPDWDILVTYHTRSLNQQFIDLVERFTFETSGDKPNWDKLRIIHSWGSFREPGVYSEVVASLNLVPINYADAKSRYGMDAAFAGICNELQPYLAKLHKNPKYDAILIDEAQDLPASFFRIIYAITKKPKRIIWAYDELQNLRNTIMPTVGDLFGRDKKGHPLISVSNLEDRAKQDIVLPVCYRNTPWALTMAHALGFGIYRAKGLVQMFDDLALWNEIGYAVNSGQLAYGEDVSLRRRHDSYPTYFQELLDVDDAIVAKVFDNQVDQFEWVADQININISREELDPDDILVIFPEAYSTQKEFQQLSDALSRREIACHLAGVSTNRDIFTTIQSVTAASIYRAKGIEAPMVYIVNSEYTTLGHELIKLRNILFTAITRSRAWIRICGIGENMKALNLEIEQVRNNDFTLKFKMPTQKELNNMRLIHRDRTIEEMGQITKAEKSIKEIMKLIESGVLNPESSQELQALINKIAKNYED